MEANLKEMEKKRNGGRRNRTEITTYCWGQDM